METTEEEVLESSVVLDYTGPSIPCGVGSHGVIWPHEDEAESATWEIFTTCDWCRNESLVAVCESFAREFISASGSSMITCSLCLKNSPKDHFVNYIKPIED